MYIQNKTKLINRTTGYVYTIVLPTSYYTVDVAKPLIQHEFKIVQGTFNRASAVAKGIQIETIHITIIWVPIDGVNKDTKLAIKHPIEKNMDTKLIVVASIINNTIPIIFQIKNI